MYRMLMCALFLAACGQTQQEPTSPDQTHPEKPTLSDQTRQEIRPDSSVSFEGACRRYCEKKDACSKGVDLDECSQRCVDSIRKCRTVDQQRAADQLQTCAGKACAGFMTCRVGQSLQCYLGI